jgi:DNA polymerase-1
MAVIINTADIQSLDIDTDERALHVYNGLDCTVTREVFDQAYTQLDKETKTIYNFERALQGPIFTIQNRGIRVNTSKRGKAISELNKKKDWLQHVINQIADAVWGKPLNPQSPDQMKKFLYGEEGLNLPTVWKKNDKGQSIPDTSREALEKCAKYFRALPIVNAILSIRDVNKKLGVLRSAIDDDSRLRASFNIAGTDTGRLSSSSNNFDTGTNLQNITEELRYVFVADEGMKLAYIDLEQAESRVVAYLSGDEAYIEACESGDLHTMVCQMVWPDLEWTGDLAQDKKVAEQPYYRHFSYRDMAKRGGHGTNYFGKPATMARHLNLETKVMEEFQRRYFEAFPGIRQWQKDVIRQLQTTSILTTPFARRRCFFGRTSDESTWRKGIAFLPQSTATADATNFGLYRVWKNVPEAQLLAQVHDAVLVQYPEDREDEVLPRILEEFVVTVEVHGRQMTLPAEAAVGWNWSKYKPETNPDGICEWEGHDRRVRQEQPSTQLLDSVVS